MNANPARSTATYFGNYNVHVLDVSINLGVMEGEGAGLNWNLSHLWILIYIMPLYNHVNT